MYFTSFDGTRIYYEYTKGNLPCLVFIHGWMANWTMWKKQLAFFQQKGYATLVMDLRGYGKSDIPQEKEKYLLGRFAKDMQLLLAHENIKKTVLIGHSMGGMIALISSSLIKKKVKGIIVCSTTYTSVLQRSLKRFSPFVVDAIDYFLKKQKTGRKSLQEVDINKLENIRDYITLLKQARNNDIKAVMASFEAMLYYDAKHILSAIQVPVLVMHGDKDKLIAKERALEMYGALPHSQLVFVKGGHFIVMSASDEVNAIIYSFLQKL
jgi:pimeloyl-ACP methyl ester carboxylesterase